MKQKIGKKPKYILISAAAFVLIAILIFLIFVFNRQDFDFKTSKLTYAERRAPPNYEISKIIETPNYSVFNLTYDSADFMGEEGKIHGLLYVPKSQEKMPAMFFLPGGGVKKEDEKAANAIAEIGYVVLVIDQRGVGETGGFYPALMDDKLLFYGNKGSVQHLGVYDALRGIDVLKSMDYVDKKNIAIGGSSMGGRYAIIAASLDKTITKALIISSSGFHIDSTPYANDSYFLSIDPDRYIDEISPAKLIMIHSANDSTIKIEDAKYTYGLANSPKAFYEVENCIHGFCSDMMPFIEKELLPEK